MPDLGTPSDHGNHYMTLGPDGMIYFNLGAPFNIGSPLPEVGTRDLTFGTIAKMTPDGRNVSTFATGQPVTHHCNAAFDTGLIVVTVFPSIRVPLPLVLVVSDWLVALC